MKKERPILFSAPMVRALLAGTKTQTRRAVKFVSSADFETFLNNVPNKTACCPYGKPGDRLWVRETHLPKASGTIYRADFSEFEAAGLGGMYGGWKPSIFCRREHSRILLEITSVRVERLQDISDADAIAEGVGGDVTVTPCFAVERYRATWESINGAGSWDANPWVWCISFEVVQP